MYYAISIFKSSWADVCTRVCNERVCTAYSFFTNTYKLDRPLRLSSERQCPEMNLVGVKKNPVDNRPRDRLAISFYYFRTTCTTINFVTSMLLMTFTFITKSNPSLTRACGCVCGCVSVCMCVCVYVYLRVYCSL